MTSSFSNRDVPPDPQPAPCADGGEQLSYRVVATQSKGEELELLMESDFEVWLRHFGAC
jgi:hypothetical protein